MKTTKGPFKSSQGDELASWLATITLDLQMIYNGLCGVEDIYEINEFSPEMAKAAAINILEKMRDKCEGYIKELSKLGKKDEETTEVS